MNELSIETTNNLTTDELVSLYKQGYSLDTNPSPQVKSMLEVVPTVTNFLLIGGLFIVGIIIYYKWMLPLRYKLESEAASKSGVKYSAVGLTGANHHH